jgi:hypothetical protein
MSGRKDKARQHLAHAVEAAQNHVRALKAAGRPMEAETFARQIENHFHVIRVKLADEGMNKTSLEKAKILKFPTGKVLADLPSDPKAVGQNRGEAHTVETGAGRGLKGIMPANTQRHVQAAVSVNPTQPQWYHAEGGEKKQVKKAASVKDKPGDVVNVHNVPHEIAQQMLEGIKADPGRADIHMENKIVPKIKTVMNVLPPVKKHEAWSYASLQKSDKVLVGKPRPAANADYRPLHELSPADQDLAHHKFGGRDMAAYHYPTENGHLLHASRKLMQPTGSTGSPVKGPAASLRRPAFEVDQGVRVQDPGHGKHGSLGLVKLPNPNVPGKIPVQFKDGEVDHFEPHQLRPAHASAAAALKIVGKHKKAR